jgi:hypothetical protein
VIVGVKYCGGCRTGFCRKVEVDRVKADVRSAIGTDAQIVSFRQSEPGIRCDILLVVCGCMTRCLDLSGYVFDNAVFIDAAGGGLLAAKNIVNYLKEE